MKAYILCTEGLDEQGSIEIISQDLVKWYHNVQNFAYPCKRKYRLSILDFTTAYQTEIEMAPLNARLNFNKITEDI